jgi:hypothetical protein
VNGMGFSTDFTGTKPTASSEATSQNAQAALQSLGDAR